MKTAQKKPIHVTNGRYIHIYSLDNLCTRDAEKLKLGDRRLVWCNESSSRTACYQRAMLNPHPLRIASCVMKNKAVGGAAQQHEQHRSSARDVRRARLGHRGRLQASERMVPFASACLELLTREPEASA
mmetsp:Transcript_434/g.1205  ORF Transcript_434/g.1205 Transcript_434/m.1205 type:complete len:129 (-) Transcript_434:991-1377(-)